MTMRGVILGTAAYMSPEQARGRPVDKRADIWAFGCVLGEMLTGRPVFDGETVTDVLGSIVKSEPDWTRLPADTPPGVAPLLRRCLQKDASERLRDIGDAWSTSMSPPQRRRAGGRVAAAGAVPAGRDLDRSTLWSLRPLSARLLRATHPGAAAAESADWARLPMWVSYAYPVISPDGRKIVYVARSRLWVQGLDEWEPRELDGTESAVRPFWSPDSQWIAYFRSEMILKVPAAGGPVVRVAVIPAVQATFGTRLRDVVGRWHDDVEPGERPPAADPGVRR